MRRAALHRALMLALVSPAAAAAVSITPATLPDPVVTLPYAVNFGASGGTAPYAFFVTGGRLPSGTQMDTDGALAGTPTAVRPYAFNLLAFDANGRVAQQTYSGETLSNAPVADPQTLSTLEDQPLPITLTGRDHDSPVLTFSISETPEHGSLAGSGAARTYTPAPDYHGPDDFQFVVSDDLRDSPPARVGLTVVPVNDAPVFVGGGSVAVPRDSGPVTRPGWATAIAPGPANEAGQQVQFAVTLNTNPALFTAAPVVAPDGTLAFTPSGQAGKAVVCVEARDDGGTANGGVDRSAPQCFALVMQTPGTDLSIDLTAPPAFVDGATLVFHVRVENAGPTAAVDADVDVLLPPQLAAPSWTCAPGPGASCAASGTGNVADSVDVPVNGVVDYTVTATVMAGGAGSFAVNATVAAGAGQDDPEPADNADTHVFRLNAIFRDGFEN